MKARIKSTATPVFTTKIESWADSRIQNHIPERFTAKKSEAYRKLDSLFTKK